jgi:hypothetical protein
MHFWTRVAVLGLCCAAPAALAESIFSFDNVTAGQTLPFALSLNGVTANFSGNAAVCATTGLSGGMFVSLTGNAIMQGFCQPAGNGPLTIGFSSELTKVSFALAINGTTSAPVTVSFLRGTAVVGTQVIQPVVPNGALSPEAAVTFSGIFDTVTISSTALLAVDNLDVIPVPSTGR